MSYTPEPQGDDEQQRLKPLSGWRWRVALWGASVRVAWAKLWGRR